MDVDYAFICDYAEATGKVNALGIGFDTIFAPKLPARHPHFYVVAQLRFTVIESGSKDMEIHLINADGIDVIPPIKGKLEVPKATPGQLEVVSRINAGFGNVEFKEYGTYSIRINIHGREWVNIPLRVAEPPKTT